MIRRIGTLRTVAQARAWLTNHGVATLTKTGKLPNLVEAVAGEPVTGSWWSHPKGKLIFQVQSGLERCDGVLVTRLVAGKVTFVDVRLWPALLRVVTDPGWRKERQAKLDAAAKRLLGKVQRDGEARGPCDALKKSLLTHVIDEHTDEGHHASRFLKWERWASPALAKEAAKWSFEEAERVLRTMIG